MSLRRSLLSLCCEHFQMEFGIESQRRKYCFINTEGIGTPAWHSFNKKLVVYVQVNSWIVSAALPFFWHEPLCWKKGWCFITGNGVSVQRGPSARQLTAIPLSLPLLVPVQVFWQRPSFISEGTNSISFTPQLKSCSHGSFKSLWVYQWKKCLERRDLVLKLVLSALFFFFLAGTCSHRTSSWIICIKLPDWIPNKSSFPTTLTFSSRPE